MMLISIQVVFIALFSVCVLGSQPNVSVRFEQAVRNLTIRLRNESLLTCEVPNDCDGGRICDVASNSCKCPPYSFLSARTGSCKAQVMAEFSLKDANIADEHAMKHAMEYARDRLNIHTEISPHYIRLNTSESEFRAIVFIGYDIFAKSYWDYNETMAMNNTGNVTLKLFRDVCMHKESNPCAPNAECFSSDDRYDVHCFCPFGLNDYSNNLETICEKPLKCHNGGTADIKNIVCDCNFVSFGQHCEHNIIVISLYILCICAYSLRVLRWVVVCVRACSRSKKIGIDAACVTYEVIDNGQVQQRIISGSSNSSTNRSL